MERTVANNPGPNPPSHALTITAQRNSDTGAVCKWNGGNREMTTAAATARTAIPYLQIKGGLRHRRWSELDIFHSQRCRGRRIRASKILTSESVLVGVDLIRGEQALQPGGEVYKRLSGTHASIHAWRQAADRVAAQQED